MCSWAKLALGSRSNTPGQSYPGSPRGLAHTGPSSPNLDASGADDGGGGLAAVAEEGGGAGGEDLEMELEAGLEEEGGDGGDGEDGGDVDDGDLEEEAEELPEGMSAPAADNEEY